MFGAGSRIIAIGRFCRSGFKNHATAFPASYCIKGRWESDHMPFSDPFKCKTQTGKKPKSYPLNVAQNRNMSTVAAPQLPQSLATIDLSGYDAEQSKLMEERCILVDEQDNAYGSGDKKTCTFCFNLNREKKER
jgi:hypothetical protein